MAEFMKGDVIIIKFFLTFSMKMVLIYLQIQFIIQ